MVIRQNDSLRNHIVPNGTTQGSFSTIILEGDKNAKRMDHGTYYCAVCRRYAGRRAHQLEKQQKHGRFYGGRSQRRRVDLGAQLWHGLFFRRDVHRLFRHFGLEVRPVVHFHRAGQRGVRHMARMEGAGPAHAGCFPPAPPQIDAAVFHDAL